MALGRTKKKGNGRTVDAARKEAEALREIRRNRFRILACVDGSDASYEAVRMAARLGNARRHPTLRKSVVFKYPEA